MTSQSLGIPQVLGDLVFTEKTLPMLDSTDWVCKAHFIDDNGNSESLFIFIGAGADPDHEVSLRYGVYNTTGSAKAPQPGTNISAKLSTWCVETDAEGIKTFYPETYVSATTIKGRRGIANVRDYAIGLVTVAMALVGNSPVDPSTGVATPSTRTQLLAFGIVPTSL